jgi:GNAT superfamily N-acetyltransferase
MAVARVHVDSWRGAYGGLLPRAVLDGLSVDRRAARWEGVLDPSSPDRVVVAEEEDRVVGFAHVGPHHDSDLGPESGMLAALYVDPGHWGTGAGRSVHDAGLECLAADGYGRAVLWMLSTNHRAAAFYRRRGWTADGRLRLQQFGGTVVLDRRLARSLPAAGPVA